MKCFLAIVVLCASLIGQNNGDRIDFTEYLSELQYRINSMHVLMEGSFDNTRFIMSGELTELNEAAVTIIGAHTQNITDVIANTQMTIASLTGNGTCIGTATANWPDDIQNAGVAVSFCAVDAERAIRNATNAVHNALRVGQTTSVNLLATITQEFKGWNPIASPEDLSYLIDNGLAQMYEQFSNTTLVELGALLDHIIEMKTTVPQIVTVCMTDVAVSMQSIATGTIAVASAC